MKRINQFKFATAAGLAICLFVLAVSCGKKQDQDPTPAAPTNNTVNSGSTEYSTMCGIDSICNLPYRILSAFQPSGYWENSDVKTKFKADSCGDTPAYAGEEMRIVYTHHGGYWGASFLNDVAGWGGKFKLNPAATKITFNLRIDYSTNVTFLAFGDDAYGKKEFYPTATAVANPVWEKVTISLLGKPTTFLAPLSVEIDGAMQTGQVVVVDIKDILIE